MANKRQRRALAKAQRTATIDARASVARAEAIAKPSTSNCGAWQSRSARFGGVGYSSGVDSATIGMRDLNLIANKRLDYIRKPAKVTTQD